MILFTSVLIRRNQQMNFLQSFTDEFQQFKANLWEKLLDYFEENLEQMKVLGLHQFGTYNQERNYSNFIPSSSVIFTILFSVEPNLAENITLLQQNIALLKLGDLALLIV